MDDYIPTYEMRAVRKGSIARRVFGLSAVLCAACITLAYATGHTSTQSCVNNFIECDENGHFAAARLGPNLIWFYFAMWPGMVAVFTAVTTWIVRGRL